MLAGEKVHPESERGRPAKAGLGRNVVVLGVVSFLTDVSSEMTITLLPLVLANVLGARTLTIGLVEGVAEATSSFGRILSGWLSDRLGKRKGLATSGYTLSAFSKPLFYFASTWGGIFVLRFADRVGKALRTAPRDALIADAAPPAHRGLNFGFHRAADTLGALLGLGLAAVIVYQSQHLEVEITRSTYQLLVLAASIPALLAVAVLVLFVKESRRPVASSQFPSLSLGGFDPKFKVFLAIVCVFTLGNSADAFLVLRAQDLGLPLFQVILALMVFNAAYSLLSVPAGRLSDRIGRRWVLASGWCVYGVTYLGFALASQAWQVWPLFVIYGIYYGMSEGVGKALVADVVAPEQRGTAYGAYNMVRGLLVLPASLLAGLLWQGVGPWQGFGASAPFILGSLTAFSGAVLLAVWLPAAAVTRQPSRPSA